MRQIRERDSDTAGSSDDEQKGWMAKMAHASAVERGNEDSGLPETAAFRACRNLSWSA